MEHWKPASGNEQSVYGLLSLCRKAGRVKSGELPVDEAIRAGKVKLLLIARDASPQSKKKMSDHCDHRRIPWIEFGEMERLGQAMGVSKRSGAAVTDAGFAEAIRKRLTAGQEVSNG
ncbi:MAG: ribosomal L7Ae/L30e/S12e/Gadd45 family protein [Lachnospiraceae bacterium]|nr:ribosomal L7Ae/L30e/S12e/Gadd45 family protein [Lachnospiraceae bacterium]